MNDLPPELAGLLAGDPYRFELGLRRGEISHFFSTPPGLVERLAERREWLAAAPGTYAALTPPGIPLLHEAFRVLHGTAPPSGDPMGLLLSQGTAMDADFLLLSPEPSGDLGPVLQGGCLCFPSSWSLEEKMGRPLEEIHSPVPGLNPALGARIQQFLSRLSPGAAWLRANWGLSRTPELNQHPCRGLPRLGADASLEGTWFRLENQALVRLPETGGILFGIRITSVPLVQIAGQPGLGRGLAGLLRTMPEGVAVYKGLAGARPRLLELLDRAG